MRVLVVDDEPDIRFIIGTSQQRWGYETAEATNAEEAYAICRDDPPDIMLLDVSMPGETGIELLDRLRADDLIPGPTALLSAAFPGQLAGVAADHGVVHLPKPFGLEDLEDLVADLASRVTG